MNTRTIDNEYRETHPTSERLYAKACNVFPTGVAHDSRALNPFPIYVNRAQGSRKWDVDGNEYVDYGMGHGALLLGHGNQTIVDAVTAQTKIGTHYSACHELEINWGSLVQKLVPSAELVRFTSSGTEATLLALRLARSFTGKNKILKFQGHFHGWHDAVALGVHPPYEHPFSKGIPQGILDNTLVAPINDIDAVEKTLSADNDIAAVIIEPSGASWGTFPLEPLFLEELREVTTQHHVLLVFDEVITGFRWAPGGVQELRGLMPDLTSMAKILAGGLPGGAVAGRADILDRMQIKGDYQWDRFERTYHPGTFNANPVSAAAGIAMLEQIADGKAQTKATKTASQLRQKMNEVAARGGFDSCVYGDASVFHVFLGPCEHRGECDRVLCLNGETALSSSKGGLSAAFRRSMINHGIDLLGAGGLVSAVHTDNDVRMTVEAYAQTLRRMTEEGLIQVTGTDATD